jgi:hypothetical protein
MRLVSLWMLYAMHLNDNSLFCVFTSLDVMCSPNSRFITETMVSFLFRCYVIHSEIKHAYSTYSFGGSVKKLRETKM